MPRVEWSFLLPAEDHKQIKWLAAYCESRLTAWGQIIMLIIIVGCAVSSVGTQISAYFLPSFILSLLLTSYFLSLFFRPQVTARRLLPSMPSAGGHYVYKVIVQNIGKRPIRNLSIFEQCLPYGLYPDRYHPQYHNTIDWLDPDMSATVTLVLRIPRRGSYELLPLIAGSSFPSGIIRSRYRIGKNEKFVVYPRIIKNSDIQTDLHRQFQPGGNLLSSKIGDSNEFASTREYREGDQSRNVHWASSARTGKLIVKEYVEEYFVRVGLFVDTELRFAEKHKWFEGRISLCAGTADILTTNHYIVDVFLSDEQHQHIQIGRGIDHLNHLLDLLSVIEGDRRVNFSTAATLLEEHASQLSTLILFLKDWDTPRARFVERLQNLGIHLRTIIIRDKPTTLAANNDSICVYSYQQLTESK